jgi:uncharacterized protein YjbJ (UPF0337 family)
MNAQIQMVSNRWGELRGDVQRQWDRLTTTDLDHVQGELDQLVHLIEQKYGYSYKTARRQVEKFLNHYGQDSHELQTTLGQALGNLKAAAGRYPWAFVASAIVLSLVIVGFVVKPFDR